MRAKEDPSFSKFLLRVGNGTEPQDIDGKIKIPPSMVIPCIAEILPLQKLIDFVFSNVQIYK